MRALVLERCLDNGILARLGASGFNVDAISDFIAELNNYNP